MKRSVILPDANLLLAYGWRIHAEHDRCMDWFESLPAFGTCPTTELAFIRISMTVAYGADHSSASKVLSGLTARKSARFIPCDLPASVLPMLSGHKQTTDCYLVKLAEKHSMRFATLDEGILETSWAQGIAFHPFRDS